MNRLAIKVVLVVGIVLGLMIPLATVRGLIAERAGFRTEARDDIARSWTGRQTLAGPILAIPQRAREDRATPPVLFVAPDTLDVRTTLRTETRRRGLHEVPVYHAGLTLTGSFDLGDALPGAGRTWSEFDLEAAVVTVTVSDNRGIAGQPTFVWDDRPLQLSAGPIPGSSGEGVHAPIGPLDPGRVPRHAFRMEFELRGMDRLQFVPVGTTTRVEMDAAWPHPGFVGRFLPVRSEIGDDRFEAAWTVSGLSTRQARSWFAGSVEGAVPTDREFGVSLVEPVDVYQQATRSVKYGALILVLTFTAFFLVEVGREARLHPMQYALVGLALVVFFVLLVALSEHVAFARAYLAAATACTALIATYLAAALPRRVDVFGVTVGLGGLYAMLYVILVAEDYALLMGSVLLFLALAAVMLITRRVDWYRAGGGFGPAVGGTTPS